MNLRWLLVFIPIGLLLDHFNADPIWVFLTSALSIVPLAGLMGDATESLSRFLGPNLGGLLNATLSNAPEIIIGFFAIHKGLVDMVKASITGSLLGNLLFGLGVSVIAGGLKNPSQPMLFEPNAAKMHSALLMLAVIGLTIPAVFDFSTETERHISLEISIVLFITYLISVISSLLHGAVDAETETGLEEDKEPWSKSKAITVLGTVTLGLAVMSEIMTDSLDPAAKVMGFTPLFAGIFLLALVGNMAELINSVRFSRKGKLDLCLGITIGGSTQTTLLVAPLLVFFGLFTGQDMNLLFSPFELVGVILTVYAVNNLLHGNSLKMGAGIFLVSIYIMLGIGFYYAPANLL